MTQIQVKYKKYYDKHIALISQFKTNDKIWFFWRNIITIQFSAKLNYKRIDFFRIQEKVEESELIYKLEFSAWMCIHSVFHISLLTLYHENCFSNRIQSSLFSVKIEIQQEWEIQEILNSWKCYDKFEYLIDWINYDSSEWF